jgi:hypothetical protein
VRTLHPCSRWAGYWWPAASLFDWLREGSEDESDGALPQRESNRLASQSRAQSGVNDSFIFFVSRVFRRVQEFDRIVKMTTQTANVFVVTAFNVLT